MSVIGFLKHYGLDRHFKLNIEPNHTTLAGHSYEHDIVMASVWDISNLADTSDLWCNIGSVHKVLLWMFPDRFGMLGSVDSNTGSPDLGWDTDQFPMDVKNTTLVMKVSLIALCHVWAEVGNTQVRIVRDCESVSRLRWKNHAGYFCVWKIHILVKVIWRKM